MIPEKRLINIGLVVAAVFFISIILQLVSADEGQVEMQGMDNGNNTAEVEGEHMNEMEHMEEGEHMNEMEHMEEEHMEGEEEMHHVHAEGAHVHEEVPEEYANFTNPYRENQTVMMSGKLIYESACIFCHGKKGDGDGLAAKALRVAPADFTDKEMVMEMTDSFWYWRVSEGIEGAGMPAWKNVLNETQRWQVINYAMNFSKGPVTKTEEEEPFYLLTEKAAVTKGAHMIGLIANISIFLIAGLIFLMFKR